MSFNIFIHREHEDSAFEFLDETLPLNKEYSRFFKKTHRKSDSLETCYKITVNEEERQYHLTSSYYIGIDWLEENSKAIQILPKLNDHNQKIDFVKMLFSALKHKEVSKNISELYEIDWHLPPIEIDQHNDILTPFLAVEYLSSVKQIVRKGLKKSYYRRERNLKNKVKGKILVTKNIKQNLMKNKLQDSICSYEEFGFDNKENRLLKKTNLFLSRYLSSYGHFNAEAEIVNLYNYVNPAFQEVSASININEMKDSRYNAFYPEYQRAIKLAKIILKRFGYNISNTEKQKVSTPPFWIDMSYLFELHSLGLLKDRFLNHIQFQFSHSGNILDFLLNSNDYQMVIDAKYKDVYANSKVNTDDIRQVSGYARLKKVYDELQKDKDEVIDCLIIHPDQENGVSSLLDVDLKENEVGDYFNIYTLGVLLPTIRSTP